jgi:hypothetical protein
LIPEFRAIYEDRLRRIPTYEQAATNLRAFIAWLGDRPVAAANIDYRDAMPLLRAATTPEEVFAVFMGNEFFTEAFKAEMSKFTSRSQMEPSGDSLPTLGELRPVDVVPAEDPISQAIENEAAERLPFRFTPISVQQPPLRRTTKPTFPSAEDKQKSFDKLKLADMNLEQLRAYTEIVNEVSEEEQRWLARYDNRAFTGSKGSNYEKEYAAALLPSMGFHDVNSGILDSQRIMQDEGGLGALEYKQRYLGSLAVNGAIRFPEPVVRDGTSDIPSNLLREVQPTYSTRPNDNIGLDDFQTVGAHSEDWNF